MKNKIQSQYIVLAIGIAAILYFQPLAHLAPWIVIAMLSLRFLIRLLRFFAPILLFVTALYIILNR